MIRRSLAALGALTAVLTMSSCSTVSSERDVARVNDTALSQDDLADIANSELGTLILGAGPIAGEITGSSARNLISQWAVFEAIVQAGFLDQAAAADTEASLVAELGPTFTAAPAPAKALAVRSVAIPQLITDGSLDTEILRAAVADADISVDSRYGAWDDDQFGVISFG